METTDTMSDPAAEPKIFPVDTFFQQLARRPGGIPRTLAIELAQEQIEQIKAGFGTWFDDQLQAIIQALPQDEGASPTQADWVDAVQLRCQHLRDIGTTMGYELVTFVAGNFCELLDAIKAGAEPNMALIDLHVEALRMSKQERYQRTTPSDVPELSAGLHRLLALAKAGGGTDA